MLISIVLFLFQQPLYGYLKEKLQVATRVYFEEKDFSRTGILEVLDIYTDSLMLQNICTICMLLNTQF